MRAAHAGPALVVTMLGVLLATGLGLPADRVGLVALAVLTSQLSIGWSNDWLDERRDRAAGRIDKPLVVGRLRPGTVRAAALAALVVTLPVGWLLGPAAAAVHLTNTAAGWGYNLGLKATAWSWSPYAVAFGGLPAFAALADRPAQAPTGWAVAAGALLGVGAHLLNALPDLESDAATGVRGLPHRLGPRWAPAAAVGVLLAASVVLLVATGPARPVLITAVAALLVLSVVAVRGSGRAPFRAAMGIALLDAILLVLA